MRRKAGVGKFCKIFERYFKIESVPRRPKRFGKTFFISVKREFCVIVFKQKIKVLSRFRIVDGKEPMHVVGADKTGVALSHYVGGTVYLVYHFTVYHDEYFKIIVPMKIGIGAGHPVKGYVLVGIGA